MIHFSDALACSIPAPEEGGSILDASMAAGVPHYHQCHGRARCTTCRVRVIDGAHHLSRPEAAEAEVLRRHNLPPEIRLACQTQVSGDVTLERVILDPSGLESAPEGEGNAEERTLAVMFCDLRRFTPFASAHLPQDVIYVLNRYFREACEPVFANRGHINQYLGDGFLALFGLQSTDPTAFCLDAVRASVRIVERLEVFNEWLDHSFGQRFECGIGLDIGTCVVGEAGHPLQKQRMVLGDSVNRASRIEEQTKHVGHPILASKKLLQHVAPFLEVGETHTTNLQGWGSQSEIVEVRGLLANDASTLVQREFDQVRDRSAEFARLFYEKLFATAPQTTAFFVNTDMEMMGAKLVKTLSLAVDHLGEPERIAGELRNLGAFHAERGIGSEHLALGGVVLLGTLEEFFGSLHPASRNAWSSAYSDIINTMQDTHP